MLAIINRLLGINIGTPTDSVLGFPLSFGIQDIYFKRDVPFQALIVTYVSGETTTVPLEVEGAEDSELDAGGPLYKTLHSLNSAPIFGEKPLGEVRRVEAQKKEDSITFSGKVKVNLFGNAEFVENVGWQRLSWDVEVAADSTTVILFEGQPTVTTKELTQHLQDNRLYYSQVIWRALDPVNIGILLSGYTWTVGGQTKPLVELVDPTPVAVIANYLVLRISSDDNSEKGAWLTKKKIKIGSRREDLVPVPSGGVFGEAVLGRFNSAEKLDITRFWNWQDSPILIQAPDIAAIQAGSRRDADNTVPGQLSAPVLNIVNAPSLPDPQGMGAVLAAIQNGNMFRDMSGLAGTIGLAQASLAGAQQGATDAAAQAGQNAAVAAELGAKVAEMAAKVAAAYFTGGASLAAGAAGGLASGNNSEKGAMINQGKDMDKRGVPSQTSNKTTGNGSSGGASGAGGGELGPGEGTGGVDPDVGNEGAAFNAALGGGSGGHGGFLSEVQRYVAGELMGAVPTKGLNATKAQLSLAEKIIKVDSSKLGVCSKEYLDRMRANIEASNLLGTGVLAGAIIVWIPKDLEDLIIGPAHAVHGIEHVVEAATSIPTLLKGTLRKQAQLAYLSCKNLTLEENNFWSNLDQLLT